uniref:hypothetical protein n=1 Tax=Prevotella aurantiaca TaxID=596085 RepID=UPI000A46DDAB|nr:hypothetical protein [Prevotella aurantiaca]
MRNKIYSLVAMLTMALALTSCFEDEEKKPENKSHATAIIAFSIKEVKAPRDTVTNLEKTQQLSLRFNPKHIDSISTKITAQSTTLIRCLMVQE